MTWSEAVRFDHLSSVSVALEVTLGEDATLSPGVRYHVVVEPVPDPLGINNPSSERWMAVQTVGADAGAEDSLRVLEKSGSGWNLVAGNVPRIEISNPAAILLSQKLAPFYAYEITEHSVPGESFVASRDFQPTSLKVLLGKTGEPTSSVTLRLLDEQGAELWSRQATPSGEGWLSLPVSGVTLAAGSRYRLVADSHAEGDDWKLLSSIGPSSSLGPPSSWDGEVSGFTQAFDRIGLNDRTSEASDYDSWASDFWAFNSSAQDALYLGDEAPFDFARVDGYVEGGTTVTFSYWNGSSWADLPTTRNTFAQNQGSGTAEWQMPQGWVTSTVGEKTAYWIRVDGTASSATPLRISRTTGIRNFKSPTAGPGGGTYVPFAWEDHDVSAIVANAWGPGDVLIGTESHPGGERFRLQCWLGGRLVPTETVDDVTTTYKWYYWASIDCQRPTVHLGLTLIWGPHDGQWIKDGSEETEGCWSHESVLCSYLSHARWSTCVSIDECATSTVYETRYKIMLPWVVTHVQSLESDPYWQPPCAPAGSDQTTIECVLVNKLVYR